jgi:hypothetical protein
VRLAHGTPINSDMHHHSDVCCHCGGEVVSAYYTPDETSAQCDTYVDLCLECGWQGEPE